MTPYPLYQEGQRLISPHPQQLEIFIDGEGLGLNLYHPLVTYIFPGHLLRSSFISTTYTPFFPLYLLEDEGGSEEVTRKNIGNERMIQI